MYLFIVNPLEFFIFQQKNLTHFSFEIWLRISIHITYFVSAMLLKGVNVY